MGSGEPAAGWEERMEVMRFGLGVESTLIGASSWLAVGVVVFKEFPTIPVSLPAMWPAEAGLVGWVLVCGVAIASHHTVSVGSESGPQTSTSPSSCSPIEEASSSRW